MNVVILLNHVICKDKDFSTCKILTSSSFIDSEDKVSSEDNNSVGGEKDDKLVVEILVHQVTKLVQLQSPSLVVITMMKLLKPILVMMKFVM